MFGISYPTDLKLLNHAREISEEVLDQVHKPFRGKREKPRTYRKEARKKYLAVLVMSLLSNQRFNKESRWKVGLCGEKPMRKQSLEPRFRWE